MKTEEVREMSDDELLAKVEDLRERIFRLRFKVSLGQADAIKNYRESKKDLARVNTILREREREKQ
ncbi:MAG: 50S ribosomal protein L29 [Acidobacteria bacterium]|nr:50S ribosomal protein L29 [Acidobacteriota bacterium]